MLRSGFRPMNLHRNHFRFTSRASATRVPGRERNQVRAVRLGVQPSWRRCSSKVWGILSNPAERVKRHEESPSICPQTLPNPQNQSTNLPLESLGGFARYTAPRLFQRAARFREKESVVGGIGG
ncbi:unnamed protein product [Tuwongella immobilis]|uniref:Uncharacterized protein n=1 Tax=Tuwongella immobilis TaxID=692036 RepID=A0A6C2YJ00_9BACT|nr:unnamed protein product [Tuwongella immobilis]VTR98652.1 unnamed protein product [Tuwongella immobilis]